MTSKITVNIDGRQITGTTQQILDVLNAKVAEDNKGPKYYSQSKGKYVSVKTMEDTHLVNAIIKYGKDYLESLRGLSVEKFYEELDKAFYWHSDETGNIGILLEEAENR